MENKESIEDKQRYLREEIIKKGYDPDKFSAYMLKIKELELSNWKMIELTSIVQLFQQENPLANINSSFYDENNYAAPLTSTQNISQIEEPITSSSSLSTTSEGEDLGSNIIKCCKQEENKLTYMDDIKIIISNPEYIKGGLFSFGYVEYTISSPDLDSHIVRVQDDFYWLREKLLKLYPATFFPPLPQSSIFKDKTNTAKLHKKVRILNRFMNSLSQNQLIRSCKLFFDFIQLPKEDFAKVKAEYSNIKTLDSIEKLTTMDGTVNIDISKDKMHKVDPIPKDIEMKLPPFKALNYALKNLLFEFEVISNKFKEVSIAFDNLSNAYAVFPNQEYLKNTFLSFANITFNWSQSYLNQKDFFKEELKEFFKYMQRELRVITSLTEEYDISRNLYIEEQKNDNNKKKISSKTQTEFEFSQAQNNFGFILNRLNTEYLRLNLVHSDRLRQLFILLNSHKNTFLVDYIKMIDLLSQVI